LDDQDPLATEDSAGRSNYAARTHGTGFDGRAGLGLELYVRPDDDLAICPYDAARYSGIHVCLRGQGPVDLLLRTSATQPERWGGCCNEDTTSCNDHFMTTFELTDQWECYDRGWGEFSQGGFGDPADLDPSRLIGFSFQAPTPNGEDFDIWVDDLAFWGDTEPAGGAGGAGGAAGYAGAPGTG